MSGTGPYWVYAEDLASALIGPFDSRAEAQAHIEFCEERGDGAEAEVLTEAEAAPLQGVVCMTMTPQEDRDYTVPNLPSLPSL